MDLYTFLSPPDSGSSMFELQLAAKKWGLTLGAYRYTGATLGNLRAPFIAHMEAGDWRHYVLVLGMSNDRVNCLDAETGAVIPIEQAAFFKQWSGYALAVGTTSRETTVRRLIWAECILAAALVAWIVYLILWKPGGHRPITRVEAPS